MGFIRLRRPLTGFQKAPKREHRPGNSIKAEPDDGYGNPEQPLAFLGDAHQGFSNHLHRPRDDYVPEQSIYQTPHSSRRSFRNAVPKLEDEFSRSGTETTESLFPSENTTEVAEDENENESAKLKGVYWPGMNMFDAATKEMKRKRNQRKDGSVLKKMKVASENIQPVEQVWSPEGELQRSRGIYDSPSIEDSPSYKSGIEKNKRRRSRQQPAEDVDHVPRQTRSMRSTRARKQNITDARNEVTNTPEPDQASGIGLLVDTMNDGKASDSYDVFGEPTHRTGNGNTALGENKLGLSHRAALHDMNSNINLASPTPLMKHHPSSHLFGPKDDVFSFHTRAQQSNHGYFPTHSTDGGSYNPLYQRDFSAYNNVGGSNFTSFDHDPLRASGFQPINGIGSYAPAQLGQHNHYNHSGSNRGGPSNSLFDHHD